MRNLSRQESADGPHRTALQKRLRYGQRLHRGVIANRPTHPEVVGIGGREWGVAVAVGHRHGEQLQSGIEKLLEMKVELSPSLATMLR